MRYRQIVSKQPLKVYEKHCRKWRMYGNYVFIVLRHPVIRFFVQLIQKFPNLSCFSVMILDASVYLQTNMHSTLNDVAIRQEIRSSEAKHGTKRKTTIIKTIF